MNIQVIGMTWEIFPMWRQGLQIYCSFLTLTICILNGYWYSLMMKGVYKLAFGKKEDKKVKDSKMGQDSIKMNV